MYISSFKVFLQNDQALKQLIKNEIIFKNHSIKELCRINHFDFQDILLFQLELGLQYNDFKLIKKSLKHLLNINQIKALQIILTNILVQYQSQKQFFDNKSFYYGLIDMAQIFLQKNMNQRIINFKNSLKEEFNIFLGQINKFDQNFNQFQQINQLSQIQFFFKYIQNLIIKDIRYDEKQLDISNFKLILSKQENINVEVQQTDDLNINQNIVDGRISNMIFKILKKNKTKQIMNDLQNYGLNQIYQNLLNDRINKGIVFVNLRKLGLNINLHLFKIASNTLRRILRKKIFQHLNHQNSINIQKYKSDFEFLDFLEIQMPEQCYTNFVNQKQFRTNNNTLNINKKQFASFLIDCGIIYIPNQPNIEQLQKKIHDFRKKYKKKEAKEKELFQLKKNKGQKNNGNDPSNETIYNYGYNLDDFQDQNANEFFLSFLEQYRVSLNKHEQKKNDNKRLAFSKEETNKICQMVNLECKYCTDGENYQDKKNIFRIQFNKKQHFGYFQGKFEWIYQINKKDREFIKLEISNNNDSEDEIKDYEDINLDNYIFFNIRHNNYLKLFGLFNKYLKDKEKLQKIKETVLKYQQELSLFMKQQIVTFFLTFKDHIDLENHYDFIQTKAIQKQIFEKKEQQKGEQHYQVIRFYVQNRLLLFLQNYMEQFEEEIKEDKKICDLLERSELALQIQLAQFRQEDLWKISQLNSIAQQKIGKVEELLGRRKYFQYLGSLMHCQEEREEEEIEKLEEISDVEGESYLMKQVREVLLKGGKEHPGYISQPLVITYLDISLTGLDHLLELLGQDEAMDYKQILNREVTHLLDKSSLQDNTPYMQHSLRRLSGPSYVYLVVTCRPLLALQTFVSPSNTLLIQSHTIPSPHLELKSRFTVTSGTLNNTIYQTLYAIAMNNLLDVQVVASVAIFLELAGFDTRVFKVDIQVARRIVHSLNRSTSHPCHNYNQKRVVQQFLNIPQKNMSEGETEKCESILNILQLLENASREMMPQLSLVSTIQHTPWNLVGQFSYFHNLNKSLIYLHELARNDDWVMLLYEAYQQGLQVHSLSNVVQGYLSTASPLNQHIRNMISLLPKEEQDQREAPDTLDLSPFLSFQQFFLQVYQSLPSSSSNSLPSSNSSLSSALLHLPSQTYQAFQEAATKGNSPLLVILLYAFQSETKDHSLLFESFLLYFQLRTNPSLQSNNKVDMCWVGEGLERLLLNRQYDIVLSTVGVFYPQIPLLSFVEFLECFHNGSMQAACQALSLYKHQSLHYIHPHPPLTSIDHIPNLVLSQILKQSSDISNILSLLEILHYAQIHCHFERLYVNCSTYAYLLHSTGQTYLSSMFDILQDQVQIYLLLIHHALFSKAILFAQYYHFPIHYVTVQQIIAIHNIDSSFDKYAFVIDYLSQIHSITQSDLLFKYQWINFYQQNVIQHPYYRSYFLFIKGQIGIDLDKFHKKEKILKHKCQFLYPFYQNKIDLKYKGKSLNIQNIQFNKEYLNELHHQFYNLSEETDFINKDFEYGNQKFEGAIQHALSILDFNFVDYFNNKIIRSSSKNLQFYQHFIENVLSLINKNQTINYEKMLQYLESNENKNAINESFFVQIQLNNFNQHKKFIKIILLVIYIYQKNKMMQNYVYVQSLQQLINIVMQFDEYIIVDLFLQESQKQLIHKYLKIKTQQNEEQKLIILIQILEKKNSLLIQQQKSNQQIYSLVEFWNFNRIMDICFIIKNSYLFYEEIQKRLNELDERQISFFLSLSYYVAILNGEFSLIEKLLKQISEYLTIYIKTNQQQHIYMFLCKILDNKIFKDKFQDSNKIFQEILEINLSRLDVVHYKLIKDMGLQLQYVKFLIVKKHHGKLGNLFYRQSQFLIIQQSQQKKNTAENLIEQIDLNIQKLGENYCNDLLISFDCLQKAEKYYFIDQNFNKSFDCRKIQSHICKKMQMIQLEIQN